MKTRVTFAAALLALGALTTLVFADRQDSNTAPAHGRYLPEYTEDGDLVLPRNWRSWVYMGSPRTPDGGDTQQRSLRVLTPGAILVSVVSPVPEATQTRYGVRAAYLHVNVTTARLNMLPELFDSSGVSEARSC